MSDNNLKNDIVSLANKFNAALEKSDTAALNQIIKAYTDMYNRLLPRIDALTLEIAGMDVPTAAMVRKLANYKSLILEIEKELARFHGFGIINLQNASDAAIKLGLTNARLLTFAGNPAAAAIWRNMNPEAIKSLISYFGSESALMKWLEKMSITKALDVANAIIDNIALGKNPRVIARIINNIMGEGLTYWLKTMRTIQLYSYRTANSASYRANSDIVEGWVWMSTLDADACMSCIAMHGTFHPSTEILDDHHNGHCAELPKLRGDANPLGSDTAGQDWFNSLPESVQRGYMGDAKFDAWKEGKFDLGDMSKTIQNDIYGDMRVVASLKDLIGE